MPFKNVKAILEKLPSYGVRFVQFTGGEPLLHTKIMKILRYAHDQGLFVSMPTNGTLVTESVARQLKASGVDLVTVSVDHCSSGMIEKIRGYTGLLRKIEESINNLKDNSIRVISSFTPTKYNYGQMKEIFEFINDVLEIPIGVAFPVESAEFFKIGNNQQDVFLNKHSLEQVFSYLLSYGGKVFNSPDYLHECLRFLRGEFSCYPCLGGIKIFFINHFGEVFDCMIKKHVTHPCTDCMLECFREPSILYQKKTSALEQFASLWRLR